MVPLVRKSIALGFLGMASVFLQSANAADAETYSASNPPPASFAFAGPVGGMVDDAGNATVYFRFVAIIHSLEPTRIQILDADSGAVLVDDAHPQLQPTPYKHPSKPNVSILQWEGHSPAETISDAGPPWLHDEKAMAVNLEIRVFEGKKMKFSFRQPASYSATAKAKILHAVEYNRSLDAKK